VRVRWPCTSMLYGAALLAQGPSWVRLGDCAATTKVISCVSNVGPELAVAGALIYPYRLAGSVLLLYGRLCINQPAG
jgi:hypothetical protein